VQPDVGEKTEATAFMKLNLPFLILVIGITRSTAADQEPVSPSHK